MKKCTRCGIEKPLSEFHKDKRRPDGFGSECIECHTGKNLESYHADPIKYREWRDKHPEKVSEYNHAYYLKNPIKSLLNIHRRRALKNNNGGSFSETEWQNLKVYYDFTCLACGRKEPEIKLTRDHVLPITQGGSNDITNIQPLCDSCNKKKGTQHIDYRMKVQS